MGLKTASVDLLLEFGGPNVVANSYVPTGWTKNIVKEIKKISSRKASHEHGMCISAVFLFQDGSLKRTTQYLVQAEANMYYIWHPTCSDIYWIEKAGGLQDVLDVLNDPSRHMSRLRSRISNKNICGNMDVSAWILFLS